MQYRVTLINTPIELLFLFAYYFLCREENEFEFESYFLFLIVWHRNVKIYRRLTTIRNLMIPHSAYALIHEWTLKLYKRVMSAIHFYYYRLENPKIYLVILKQFTKSNCFQIHTTLLGIQLLYFRFESAKRTSRQKVVYSRGKKA